MSGNFVEGTYRIENKIRFLLLRITRRRDRDRRMPSPPSLSNLHCHPASYAWFCKVYHESFLSCTVMRVLSVFIFPASALRLGGAVLLLS